MSDLNIHEAIAANGLDPHENPTYTLVYKPEQINGEFAGKHIISVEQFSRKDLDILFDASFRVRQMVIEDNPILPTVCQGKTMVAAFEQASTHTDLSFQAAMGKLGGNIIAPVGGWDFSSKYKGERGSDTTRAEACYADVIVHRHPDKGSTFRAAYHVDQLVARGDIDTHPVIISGGDGAGEHPTQALLDLFTIIREKGGVDNLTITFVGDLLYGRTVHSLAKLLVQYQAQNITLNLVSPNSLRLPEDIIEFLLSHNIPINQTSDITSVVGISDIIYWTRIQKEQFKDNPQDYEAVKDSFILTPTLVSQSKPNAIFMHPLPRTTEMGTPHDHDILDGEPRTKWITQMQNGLYVRMALLAAVTGRLDRVYA